MTASGAPTCVFCIRPRALGDRTACVHHRAILASVIDPDQAQWQRDHPNSTWVSNAKEERRMRQLWGGAWGEEDE